MKKYLAPKFLFSIPALVGASFLLAGKALAVCPLCTIAVASGLGFSRWLGIDDSISGLWIGGLTVSMIFWTISFWDKKKIVFWGRDFLTAIAYYLLVILPLYYYNIFVGSLNIFSSGADKLFLGTIAGSAAFWAGAEWYIYLKARNNNKVYFPFQKIVFPVAPLLILSIILYFITK
jgi:hypothetical protein